ncbi:hypothetical protein GCM10022223_51060 [Kineosporia mesophila]|uniref:Uncharacterized protein n=1 Tax=Kineosporia mesophila TaxID=566012 RepID=A0ABP7A9I9_9ACTN
MAYSVITQEMPLRVPAGVSPGKSPASEGTARFATVESSMARNVAPAASSPVVREPVAREPAVRAVRDPVVDTNRTFPRK